MRAPITAYARSRQRGERPPVVRPRRLAQQRAVSRGEDRVQDERDRRESDDGPGEARSASQPSWCAAGPTALTVVPDPTDEAIVTLPPTASRRSRMFISPAPAASARALALVEARAVVGDVEAPAPAVLTQPHRHPGRPGVLGGVLDRLHAAEVERGLQQGRGPSDVLGLDGDRDRAGSDPRSQGRDEPLLRQHLGIDPAAQRRQGVDGEPSRVRLLGQHLARPVG